MIAKYMISIRFRFRFKSYSVVAALPQQPCPEAGFSWPPMLRPDTAVAAAMALWRQARKNEYSGARPNSEAHWFTPVQHQTW